MCSSDLARDGFAYTTWYDNFDNYDYHDNYNNQNKQKDYYNGDLVVVDARDPLVLTEAARVDLENAMSIALEDNFAYVGEGHEDELNGALSIVDVADPENPVIRSTISLAGASWAIKPVEHTLFIAARSAGLLIVDATDPDNPQQIGQLELGDLANGIEVWGALALIATNMRGLVIVDISDPENPLELGSVNTAGKAQDIQAEGSYLFMTDETNGLEIFKLPSVSLSILR